MDYYVVDQLSHLSLLGAVNGLEKTVKTLSDVYFCSKYSIGIAYAGEMNFSLHLRFPALRFLSFWQLN